MLKTIFKLLLSAAIILCALYIVKPDMYHSLINHVNNFINANFIR